MSERIGLPHVEKAFIWFDLGYTLLYRRREELFHNTLAEFDLKAEPDTVERTFHLVDKQFMREFPGVFGGDPRSYMPWYLGILQYRLGLKFDLCRFFARWQANAGREEDSWVPYPFVHQALTDLQAAGHRLGIISNWDGSARRILERYGLGSYFEHIIISSELGVQKPDPRIFREAMRRAQVPPEACVYVGDNYYDDVVGSRKAGMRALLVNRFDRLGIEEIDDCAVIRDIREVGAFLKGAPR